MSPAGAFRVAEPERQDCLERIPHGYTCHLPRPGWKLPVRSTEHQPTLVGQPPQ